MHRSIKYMAICFMALVILDSASFDFTFSKKKFGIFDSVVNVVLYAKSTYKLFF